MAEVHIVDIDGEQWDIKDLPLTSRVAILEEKISGLKVVRHDISQNPPRQPICLWDCVMNQIPSIDWSFITKDVWAYGVFLVQGICFGTYEAVRHVENSLEVKGTLTYNGTAHTFSAFYNSGSNLWDFQIDNEAFGYLQNNILITQTVDRQYNNFSVPSQLFVRNVGPITIGNLYAALETSGLLYRPSTGSVLWDLQRQHNGVDLPKGRLGNPAYANTAEFDFSGRYSFSNVRIGAKDVQNNSWILNWSDGNLFFEANMFGEPDAGVIPTVSLVYTV